MGTELNHPFNEQEKEVMDAIVEAHKKFCELQKTGSHRFTAKQWEYHLNGLQDAVIVGNVMRKYPDYFRSE